MSISQFSVLNPFFQAFIGDRTVGKSTLYIAYEKEKFLADLSPMYYTLDAYQTNFSFGDANQIKLSIRDTAGQEDIEHIHERLLVLDPTIVLCFACDNKESFKNITRFWMPEILSVLTEVRVILCGTKSDLYEEDNEYHVSLKEARNLGRRIQAHRTFFCSSKDYCSSIQNDEVREGNVDEIFKAALRADISSKSAVSNIWISTKICCIIL